MIFVIIMDRKSIDLTLSNLYRSSESKRNTAYDALSEEFEDDFCRLMKELIDISSLIGPSRVHKYIIKRRVIEYGDRCESIDDLRIILSKLKLLAEDVVDGCFNMSDNAGDKIQNK